MRLRWHKNVSSEVLHPSNLVLCSIEFIFSKLKKRSDVKSNISFSKTASCNVKHQSCLILGLLQCWDYCFFLPTCQVVTLKESRIGVLYIILIKQWRETGLFFFSTQLENIFLSWLYYLPSLSGQKDPVAGEGGKGAAAQGATAGGTTQEAWGAADQGGKAANGLGGKTKTETREKQSMFGKAKHVMLQYLWKWWLLDFKVKFQCTLSVGEHLN